MTALAGLGFVILALIAPGTGAQEQSEPRLPTELWKTYPLDPKQGEAEQQAPGTTATTTTGSRPQPSSGAPPQARTSTDRGGSVAVAVGGALGGLAVLIAVGFAFVVARRRGRLPAFRLPSARGLRLRLPGVRGHLPTLHLPQARGRLPSIRLPRRQVAVVLTAVGAVRVVPALAVVPVRRLAATAGAVRLPRVRMPQRLRSEAGWLLPLARRPADEKRLAERAAKAKPQAQKRGQRPPQKALPGLAPPPAKEKQLRSGLPPGKTVPPSVEPPAKEPPVGAATKPAVNAAPPTVDPRPGQRRQRFGEPRRPSPRATPLGAEECEIEWWRGYIKSDFYAFALRPDGTPRILARSPSFRWRSSDPPPPEGPAVEAYAALIELLTAWGWESAEIGGPWYRTRLRRRLRPTLRDLAG